MTKTILIIDDDHANLTSLKMLLKFGVKGIKVVTATSAATAEPFLKSGDIKLVLADVNIGNDYGPDIRAEHQKIPFIYLTGDSTWKSPDGEPTLHKPYAHDKLFGLIATKLSESLSENLHVLTRLLANSEITIEDAIKDLLEVSPPGWSGTTKAMKNKHSAKIDNPYALAWWMHNKGEIPHYKPEQGKPRYKAPSRKRKLAASLEVDDEDVLYEQE